MTQPQQTLIDLENKFWQSMVDQDADTAVQLLDEPALMVSAHGAFQFDHAGYRKMADQGTMTLASFALRDVKVAFPNPTTAILTYSVKQQIVPRGQGKPQTQDMHDTSTWIQKNGKWLCVMHTETPVDTEPMH